LSSLHVQAAPAALRGKERRQMDRKEQVTEQIKSGIR
jgi:hypothetical protein